MQEVGLIRIDFSQRDRGRFLATGGQVLNRDVANGIPLGHVNAMLGECTCVLIGCMQDDNEWLRQLGEMFLELIGHILKAIHTTYRSMYENI